MWLGTRIQTSCEELEEGVSDICRRIAGTREIVAACFYGSQICRDTNHKDHVDILLVLKDFRLRLKSYQKSFGETNVLVLVVDKRAFERDVGQGWLGEFVADKITIPYQPFVNDKYLWQKEVKMKKRIIQELLKNMIWEYPELSHEFLIKTEYFMYKAMKQRARLFPPIAYSYLNMLDNAVKTKTVESTMKGYLRALKELAEEDKITFSNRYIKITPDFIKTIKTQKLRIPTFLKSLQKAALANLVSVFPKMTVPFTREEENFRKAHQEVEVDDLSAQLEEPEEYLLISTPLGLVALSDETTIEDFVRNTVPDGGALDVTVEKTGGVLNDVYYLKLRKDGEEQRIVVKKFKDWHGFKWFPLALWAMGTKAFAVLGQSRLEREYSINQFLSEKGFLVPKILSVSPREGLIFEEYIKGETLVHNIKQVISSNNKQAPEGVALVKEVGKKIAEAHRLGITFGDCKPENILVTDEKSLYFVDLEQASRDGNQAWDVAEFLYYSGHYAFPFSSTKGVEFIVRKFIEGYLEGGGKEETVRKAASPKYTKVFSIFTPPHIILAISNLCRNVRD
jgi:tRNA A-37 threonylcarbamoyl transferase component Bud32